MYSKLEEKTLENLKKFFIKDFKINKDEIQKEIKSYAELQKSINNELTRIKKEGFIDDEKIKTEMRLTELSNMDYIGKISLALSFVAIAVSFLVSFLDDWRIRLLILAVCAISWVSCEIAFSDKKKMQSEIAYLSLKIDCVNKMCEKQSKQ